jgi:hypothetical protein
MVDIDALRTGLDGKVSAAEDPGWDIARQAFNDPGNLFRANHEIGPRSGPDNGQYA